MNMGYKKIFSMLGAAMFLLSVVFIPAGESTWPRDVEENSVFRSDAAVIYGWVNDSETGIGIEGASVFLSNWDIYYYNSTVTNETGYYEMGYPGPGTTFNVYVYAEGYKDFYGEVTWEVEYNISLEPKLPENSVVCGYIKDAETGDGIYDAYVSISGTDVEEQWYWNSTSTNETGYYRMNVPEGNFRVYASKYPYRSNETGYFDVSANIVVWKNLTLSLPLAENSIVCGYIKDAETGEGIYDAYVSVMGTDADGEGYYNSTYTSETGFYEMNAPAGNFYVYASKWDENYHSNSTDYFDVSENIVIWKNLTLKPLLPENSVVCGYVTDLETGEGINNSYVSISGDDADGYYYYNSTYTNESGYYEMNVPAGNFYVYAIKWEENYHSNSTDYFDVSANIVVWKNLTLKPPLSENSIVCGYIKDSETDDGINDAYVSVSGWDADDSYYSNSTSTNETGYYRMNVPEGNFRVYASKYPYRSNETGYFDVSANIVVWKNLTLGLPLPENSIVCGYVTDFETGEGINNSYVSISGDDADGYYYWNSTYTNETGYYKMNVPAGEYHLYASKWDGYHSESTDDFDVSADTVVWKNITLKPELPENSIVCGYITDSEGKGLNMTDVHISGEDIYEYDYWNYTYTNETGYYEMNVPTGIFYVSTYIYMPSYSHAESDYFFVGVNATFWQNLTLELHPENSVIHGYVTDSETGEGISNAEISIETPDYYWSPWDGYNYYSNYTYTNKNETGYYEINVPVGDFKMTVHSSGYYAYTIGVYVTQQNSVITKNIALEPGLEENSTVKGYVEDLDNNPLSPIYVRISGKDISGHYYENATYTDETGYYEMNLPVGDYQIDVEYYWYSYDFENPDYNMYNFAPLGLYVLQPNSVIWQNLTPIEPLPETSIIRGYITDFKTGEGIADANVYVGRADGGYYPLWGLWGLGYYEPGHEYWYSNSTSTNETGYYEINVPEGKLGISACASGYDCNSTHLYVQPNSVVWKNLTLQPPLPENSVVKGYVKDSETGEGIKWAGVSIHTYYKPGEYGGYNWYWNYTSTNESGYYEMNLPKGEFEVYVSKYGYESNSTKISVDADSVKWLNISLEPPAPENAVIKGYVLNSTGEPILHANVNVNKYNGYYYNSTHTNLTGYYEINVADGNYSINVYANNYESESAKVIVPENETVWLNITLQRPEEKSTIYGYITDLDTGEPVKGIRVILYIMCDGTCYSEERTAYTNETGYYQFTKLSEGRYEIKAGKEYYFYFDYEYGYEIISNYYENKTRVKIGTNEIIRQDLGLEPLLPETSLLKGHVTDSESGEIIKGASIYLFGKDVAGHFYSESAYTNETGYYQLRIRPGEYRIRATKIGYFENRAEVTLIADGIIQQDMSLIHVFQKTSVISGYVYNATGEPIKHASVMIYNTTYYYCDSIVTDENGYYEIYTWGGEFYLMSLGIYYWGFGPEEVEGYKTNITKVNIPENDKINVNIYLEPGIPDEEDTTITFSDWGSITVDSKYTMNIQSTFIRLMIDSWGNSDGYVSQSEVNEWMDMMMEFGGGVEEDFPITVDGVYYETVETSYYFENLIGEITSSAIIIAHFIRNCTADIEPALNHTVELEISYDTTYSTVIYHINLPIYYELIDYEAPENVSVSGTTNVTIDPGKYSGEYWEGYDSNVVTMNVRRCEPTLTSTTVEGKDVTVIYNGTGTLTVRSATLSEIEIPKKNLPSGMVHIGIFIEIDTTGTVHDAFITIKYNDSDVVDIDASKLRMYYWNETISEWVLIEDSGVWTNNNTVWARISHFTIFAPMAEKTAAGPAPISWLIWAGVIGAVIIIIVISLATAKRKKKPSS